MTIFEKKVLSTGYPELDDVIDKHGVAEGDVLLINAGAGNGKTATLINLAINLAKQKAVTLHFATEESPETIQNRYLAIQGIKCVSPLDNSIEYSTVNDNIHITNIPPYSTIADVKASVAMFEAMSPDGEERWADVILIDNLDLLTTNTSLVNTSPYERLGAVLQEVSQWCKADGRIGLVACQRTRAEANGQPAPYSRDRQMIKTLPSTAFTIAINRKNQMMVFTKIDGDTTNEVVSLPFDMNTAKIG